MKWHYPIGLLFDLYSGSEPAYSDRHGDPKPEPSQSSGQIGEETSVLPWRLTVHFTDWPDDQLVKLDEEGKVMHDAFINSVKEARFPLFLS
jgi:autophagy-related protein 5